MLNITHDYDSFINCRDDENEDDNINIDYLLFVNTNQCNITMSYYFNYKDNCWTFNNWQIMDKFWYLQHPVRCFITGPSERGKWYFPTQINLYFINELEKKYIFYSPSFHQGFYQKLVKYFGNYIAKKIFANILNDKETDPVTDEIVNDKALESSGKDIQTCPSKEELKYLQEFDGVGIIIQDDLNEKKMDDPHVQAIFKRSGHNGFSVFIIRQDYYDLPKKTIRANGNIYHIFNNFTDV